MKKLALALGVAAFVAAALPAAAANGWFDPRDPNSLTRQQPEKPYALTGTSRDQSSYRGTTGDETTKPSIKWGQTSSHRQVMTDRDSSR